MLTYEDVLDYIESEDVKFIRLSFCDVNGREKAVAIMPEELRRAFTDGISFDASSISGFEKEENSDLFLVPDPSTLSILPWHPAHGRMVRMYCSIRRPDGTPYEKDSRRILREAVAAAEKEGISCFFGTEFEFYLFRNGENGEPTKELFDFGGYMDTYPADRGENIRREICSTLCEMGLHPEAAHHEEGPSQHEIDFRYSDACAAADNAITFRSVVETIANRNGLCADFSPKPVPQSSGNGLHINMSVKARDGRDCMMPFIAGILEHIAEITAFLNPTDASYERLGRKKAPHYITWSPSNRSQLIRIPAAEGEYRRLELRSPDAGANPYLAFALLIYAGMDGIRRGLTPPAPCNSPENQEQADALGIRSLPSTLEEAKKLAHESRFVAECLPEGFLNL